MCIVNTQIHCCNTSLKQLLEESFCDFCVVENFPVINNITTRENIPQYFVGIQIYVGCRNRKATLNTFVILNFTETTKCSRFLFILHYKLHILYILHSFLFLCTTGASLDPFQNFFFCPRSQSNSADTFYNFEFYHFERRQV